MQTIKKFAVIAVTAGLLVSPMFAFAISASTNANASASIKADINTGANFCSKINATTSTINNLVAKLQKNRGTIRMDMLKSLSDRINLRAASIAKIRATAKVNFTADIAKLNAKATTDAQKAAIVAFQASVQSSLTIRQQAVDAAISTYKTAAQGEVTNRESAVEAAATAFQSNVQIALTQAKTDCSNNVAPATARTTFKASLASANANFKTSVTGLADGQIIAFASTRDQAIQAANAAFRTNVQQAVVTLKASFATQ